MDKPRYVPKLNDQVVCVDDSAVFNRLQAGGAYTVSETYDGKPTVEIRGSYHSIERFRLVGAS